MINTKQQTKNIISQLKQRIKDGEDPVDVLENAFEGRSVLIISGGPSAIHWQEVLEKNKDEQPVVVCIKEAIKLAEDLCDIHFLNSANLIRYETHFDALTIMTHNAFSLPVFRSYDVNFHILNKLHGKPSYLLAARNNFECFSLKNTGVYRPVGPGIMHESVVFTLVHLGFKKITTIGWDIADEEGLNTHFNDKRLPLINRSVGLCTKENKKPCNLKVYLQKFECAKKLYLKLYAFIPYQRGLKINKALMGDGEAELVSSSLPEMRKWLQSNGVTLEIKGGSKWTA